MPASVISVHITGIGLNDADVDVRVTDFVRVGESIPERLNVLAAEAAALADMARKIQGEETRPFHRDRTTTRAARN